MDMKILYIIRGVSGSGKTTYAEKLAYNENCLFYEADMFFIKIDGTYKFAAGLLPAAHAWCFEEVTAEILDGNTVIVSNTFTQHWEMKQYIDLALEHDYRIVIVECSGQYQNKHGVSDIAVAKQKARYESNEKIAAEYYDLIATKRMTFCKLPDFL